MQQTMESGAKRHTRSHALRGFLAVTALTAVLGVGAFASACGGGDDDGTPTAVTTKTATKTAAVTKTPASAGLKTPIAFSEGDVLTDADLASRGTGEPARGEFTGTRLIIPSIGVDAPFSIKQVPTDGVMPNPNGPEDVAWYDFAQWPGLGGIPVPDGDSGSNVVLAGHVDYINYGPAVFWEVPDMAIGDEVQIVMADGTVAKYRVEFSKVVTPDGQDWSKLVAGTSDESVTLITCVGSFVGGSYTNRQIVWGRRVA